MSKKNVIIVPMKAVDSAFYYHKSPKTGQSLEEQGILEYARAPTDFAPDMSKLACDTSSLAELAYTIKDYDESQMRILLYTLNESHKLLKHGLRFGQQVFKNLSSPAIDYVDCWFRCFVLRLGPVIEGVQYVELTGSLDNIHGSLILCPIDSFLNKSEFRVHMRKLVAEGMQRSPRDLRAPVIRHGSPTDDLDNFPTLGEVADKLTNGRRENKEPRQGRRRELGETFKVV